MNSMKRNISLLVFLLFLSQFGFSQSYLISAGGTVTACSGDFFDGGDQTGNYGDNENFTMTIHAPAAPNTHIKMIWNAFDVEPGDTLFIHDGSSTGAPLIGKYNNNNLPPSFTQASVYNASGDLTFHFVSNGQYNSAGWWGGFICGTVCQEVIAAIDTNVCLPLPDDSNYINICFGDNIHFAALSSGPGVFPQNNALYAQSAATSTFEWDFGDGVIATGPVVDHLYTVAKGYDVTLKITDVNGCYNANSIGIRVRISSNPIAQINPLADMCSSIDTTIITLGYSIGSSIIITPITSHQQASQKYDSVTFIPDGPSCPPGCYSTNVTFNDFAPGQTITNGNQVLSVVISIEHSFAGDLGFTLYCPNGQNVVLDANDHSGGAGLGIGYEPDGSNICDPANNIPGTPWIYGWSQIYPQQGSLNTLDGSVSFPVGIPAADTINHTGYFTPDQSFANLVGCPLNGTWNIEICDNWGSDNGYIFMWGLNLDPSLLPVGWGYTVPIDTVYWTGNFFTVLNDTTIMAIPDSSGIYGYGVHVVDEYGCTYDTTIYVQVVQTPEVDLGNDTIICDNTILYLDGGTGDYYSWSTGSHNQTVPVGVNGTGFYVETIENYNLAHTLTCADQDTLYVRALRLPDPFDLGPDLCIHDQVIFDAQNPGPPFHYDWNTGDTNQTITVTTTGSYDVTVAEMQGYNCEMTDNVNVIVFPVPSFNIGQDSTICNHQTIEIRINDLNGALDDYPYEITWWPFSSNNSEDRYITVSRPLPNLYTVICEVKGCELYADTLMLNVEACPLEIPNVFTPNGDGHNDYFVIENIEFYPNSTMLVYNRWGRKVYENNNYQGDWDGEKCSDGVYFFVFTANYGNYGNGDELKQQNGTVTILR
jgi:gliding motility-associated-like protein